MAAKDFYVVLGISPEESQSGIKSAYRDLAMKYHPDRAGPHMTRQFQEVVEAYQVLGDPQRRADYDRKHHRMSSWSPVHPDIYETGPPIEPFEAGPVERFESRGVTQPTWRLSLLEDFIASQTVREEILDRLFRNYTGSWMPKSGRVDALKLGIGLTAEDARWGGEVEIGIPVFTFCPICRGTGRVGFWYACQECRGGGALEQKQNVLLVIPAMVTDGTVIEHPLDRLGIRDLYLRAMIRVGD